MRIYTRSSNEVTAAVPEIVEAAQGLPAREMILDGEAIAFTADGRPHPFQVTMRRFGRKLDVEKLRGELPMQAFFFDCLHFEGESLTGRPARERFAALARAVPRGADHSAPHHRLQRRQRRSSTTRRSRPATKG